MLISERFRNFVEESKFLSAEDRKTMDALRRDPEAFATGKRSLFTPAFIRRMASSWVTDVSEVEAEGKRLFPTAFLTLRYEDLLREPFEEMSKVWRFLGVKRIAAGLAKDVQNEMSSNPDEEWQTRRNEDIASFLAKGQAGNWRMLFTAADKRQFKEVAGATLVKWGYEKDLDW